MMMMSFVPPASICWLFIAHFSIPLVPSWPLLSGSFVGNLIELAIGERWNNTWDDLKLSNCSKVCYTNRLFTNFII